jgi:hypothetical protein
MPMLSIAATGAHVPAVLTARVPAELSELAAFGVIGHLAAAARLLSTSTDDEVTAWIARTPSHLGVGAMLRAMPDHLAAAAWTVHVEGKDRW